MESPVIAKVKVYTDAAGEHRFTAYATNGAAIAVSSEGYVNRADAEGAATALFPEAVLVRE